MGIIYFRDRAKDDPKVDLEINRFLYSRRFTDEDVVEKDPETEGEEGAQENDESDDDGFENEDSDDWHIEMDSTLGELMNSDDYDIMLIRKMYFEEIHKLKFNSLSYKDFIPEIPDGEIDQFVEYLKTSLD